MCERASPGCSWPRRQSPSGGAVDFSFRKDKGGKLKAPEGTTREKPYPSRVSEVAAPTSAKSFSVPSSGYSYTHLQGRRGTLLAVPVEEHGLHQGDDVSAGVMTRTHDSHLQELGRGHQVGSSLLLPSTVRTHGWAHLAQGSVAPPGIRARQECRGELRRVGVHPLISQMGKPGQEKGRCELQAPPAGRSVPEPTPGVGIPTGVQVPGLGARRP